MRHIIEREITKMKEKLLIYPYDFETEPVVKYADMLVGYEISSLVSLKGLGFVGEKYVIGKHEVIVKENFEEELEKATVVWFTETHFKLDFKKYFLENFKYTVKKGKKVLITKKLTEEEKVLVDDILPEGQKVSLEKKFIDEQLSRRKIYHLNTPTIVVCGLYEGLGKFDVQMSLRREFNKRGLKVLQIGTKRYSNLFGIECIPDFIFKNEISAERKIVKFNHFLKMKELEQTYDLIILGIPGELTGLKENIFSDLGIYAFMMLRTIQSDYTVLCLPCEININENKKMIASIIRETFRIPIDSFNICPLKIDMIQSNLDKEISYVELDTSFVMSKIDKSDMFCVAELDEQNRLAEDIIFRLTEYGK